MEDARPEEKSPLLLYLVEGETNVSKNNKRVSFDKGRLYGISSGATAVFTDFPNYISPCWITALISTLIFFMMVLLMVSSMVPSSSLRVPRCQQDNREHLGNNTIHLVHPSGNWSKEQLEAMERIKNEYGGFDVHLVLLQIDTDKRSHTKIPAAKASQSPNSREAGKHSLTSPMNRALIEIKRAKRMSKKSAKNGLIRKKRQHLEKMPPVGIGFGVKSLLDILLRNKVENVMVKRNNNETLNELPSLLNLTELFAVTSPNSRPKTLDDVLCDIPGLTIRNVTPQEIFSNSPLHHAWTKLSPELLVFAARIMHLWQYGGLSFKVDGDMDVKDDWDDLGKFSVAPGETLQTLENASSRASLSLDEDKLVGFILKGKESFERMPKEVVTADDEGLHIFTKSPCHVFFGEVLVNLKRSKGDETPKQIIQKSLKVFCRHSAVGNNYCRNLIRNAA